MINSTNYTIFGMHRDAERYAWACYTLFVLLSSFIGDTLILIASLQKDAFKINKSIVTIIQHIAISDLAISTSRVLPTTVSLFANGWILGDTLCNVQVYFKYNTYITGLLLIAFLTSSKLILLKYPRQAANWTTRKVNLACIIIWIIPTLVPVLCLVLDKDDVYFDYTTYNCAYRFNADAARKLIAPIALIFTFVPNIIVVATTVPTLKYLYDARKSARKSARQDKELIQGALTVALTAVVYFISSLPLSVYVIGKPFTGNDPTGPFQFHLLRISQFVSMINVMSNFFIYTLTITSFRKFLLSTARELFFRRNTTVATDEDARTADNSKKSQEMLQKTPKPQTPKQQTQEQTSDEDAITADNSNESQALLQQSQEQTSV